MDERINVLATIVKGHLTVFDLPELELMYVPPSDSAKDPANMLGYVVMNVAEGLSETVQQHGLSTELAKGKILLDMQTAGELEKGKSKEVRHTPLGKLWD